jgi:cytoskeletal protein RodZ
MQTPRDVADAAYATSVKSSPPALKADKWLAGLVLLVLLVAVGIYSVRQLTKAHPKNQANAATPAPVAPAASAPSAPKLVDKPTSVAGKAIAKARDLVAAREKQEKEQGVTALLEEPVAADAAKTTPTSSNVASAATSPEAVVPAVAQLAPPPPVSDAFRQFVVNVRVNGVFQGENPRAMLNGKMYHPGDIVEPKLSISLFKIEVEAKQIIFRDADGAIVPRHY